MTSKLGTFGLNLDEMEIESFSDEGVDFPLKPIQTNEEDEEEEEEEEEEMEEQEEDADDDIMKETYPEDNIEAIIASSEASANFLPNQLSLNSNRLHLMSRALFDDYTTDHVAAPSFSKRRRRMNEEITSGMDQSEDNVSLLMETAEDETCM